MKFVRRGKLIDYLEDQQVEITIGSGGGTDTDTVEDLPIRADEAIEVEMDDGSVYVLLAYKRK